jgi:phthiocerol/phenolphthiocerol synthesis type-I polyketide synthase E
MPSQHPAGGGSIRSQRRRPCQLLVLSAHSHDELGRSTEDMARQLAVGSRSALEDVARRCQRMGHAGCHRRAHVCRTAADAAAALRAAGDRAVYTGVAPAAGASVVFMFPGAGSQHAGMARDLYAIEPVFRAGMDACLALYGPGLEAEIRVALGLVPDPPDVLPALERPRLAVPALFATEYALAGLWMSWGLAPAVVIGHSTGEFAAACVAGMISLDDAAAMIVLRARLLDGLPMGAMLTVAASRHAVEPWLTDEIGLAAVNGEAQCVVAGRTAAVERLRESLAERGLDTRILHIAAGGHSPLVESISERFGDLARTVTTRPPATPYVSCVTGTWLSGDDLSDGLYWTRHLRQTVQFSAGLSRILERADRSVLEVGPGHTLTTLARQHPDAPAARLIVPSLAHPLARMGAHEVLLRALGRLWISGARIDWEAFQAAGGRAPT